jgi:hypothetical protein
MLLQKNLNLDTIVIVCIYLYGKLTKHMRSGKTLCPLLYDSG